MTPDQEQLAVEHKGLVYYYAKEIGKRAKGHDFGDLVGDGMVGLCKAANNFDPDRGAKFATYAGVLISNEIREGCRRRHHLRRTGPNYGEPLPCEHTFLADIAPSSPSFEDRLVDDITSRDAVMALLDLVRDERERAAVAAIAVPGESLRLAGRLGVTESRVSQLRHKGIEAIKAALVGVSD